MNSQEIKTHNLSVKSLFEKGILTWEQMGNRLTQDAVDGMFTDMYRWFLKVGESRNRIKNRKKKAYNMVFPTYINLLWKCYRCGLCTFSEYLRLEGEYYADRSDEKYQVINQNFVWHTDRAIENPEYYRKPKQSMEESVNKIHAVVYGA